MKWYGEPIKNGCYYLFRNAIIVKSRFWKRNCYYYLKDQVLHLVVAANYKVVNSKRVIFDHQKFRKWFSDYRLIIFRSYLFPQKTNYTDYLYKDNNFVLNFLSKNWKWSTCNLKNKFATVDSKNLGIYMIKTMS